MRTLLIILGLAATVAILFRLILRNTVIFFRTARGVRVILSRRGIRLEPPPDRHTEDAFAQIEAYVSRLFGPSRHMQFVTICTTTGNRGLGLKARDGEIEALFAVEWRQEPAREAVIRAFFNSRNTAPTEDYLAGNGAVPDATRMLAYPLPGGPREVAALTRHLLQDLCGVSADDPLDISYTER